MTEKWKDGSLTIIKHKYVNQKKKGKICEIIVQKLTDYDSSLN